jgi:anti-anti-sigma factor
MTPHRNAPLLHVEQDGDHIVAKINATVLDEITAQAVAAELFRLVEDRARPHLRLDLSGVRYLTSTTLAKFLLLDRRVRAAGGDLVLADATAPVYEIFRITHLLEIFDVRPAEEGKKDILPPLAS